jgi:acyl-coenzyme A thioesterase PaaI-like protein
MSSTVSTDRTGTVALVEAFQDQMHDNFCWGCGADNPDGLQLKSHWDGDVAVAQWQPHSMHAAGPRHVLNGGIIATLLDCHGVCTAIADAYAREGRAIGSEPDLWYATASMGVDYLRPARIEAVVSLRGRVAEVEDRFTTVECELETDGKVRAGASVRAVRVPDSWRHGSPAG